jgi:hypothetical protein
VWRLLKAEIAYNMQVFLFILLTSLVGFFGIHFWPVLNRQPLINTNTGYVYLAVTYSYFIMAALVTPWAKEKRSRQLVYLPLSVRQIKGAHGMLHLTYWAFIVALFFVWIRISEYFILDRSVFLAMGVMTGISGCAYSILAFASRFRDSVARGVIQIALILFFGTVAVAGIVHTYQGKGNSHAIDELLSWIFRSPVSVLIWMFAGIGSAVWVLSLPRQNSYGE